MTLALVLPCSSQTPVSGAPQSTPAQPQRTAPPERSSPRFIVVLDAAHGGDDNGGQVGASTPEKNITLDLSVRLRSILTARGFQVVTTREGNVNLTNDARAQIANRVGSGAGAAACISLHATETGSGVHIFVSSLAPAAPSRFLAWKTAQAAYVTRSLKLASVVNSALERGSDTGPIAANLARTSLPGLESMACPAVALEVAPIRGDDHKVITDVTDTQYQTQIVEALAAAMLEWRTEATSDGQHDEPRKTGDKTP
jgi:N-acetylmuramoyl-L-alanine amidase